MRYEKRHFKNEIVIADDNELIDCTYENCTLSYGGGPFSISGQITVIGGLRLQFRGLAANTMTYLQCFYGLPQLRKQIVAMLDPRNVQIEGSAGHH
jgi:hypothetical protein